MSGNFLKTIYTIYFTFFFFFLKTKKIVRTVSTQKHAACSKQVNVRNDWQLHLPVVENIGLIHNTSIYENKANPNTHKTSFTLTCMFGQLFVACMGNVTTRVTKFRRTCLYYQNFQSFQFHVIITDPMHVHAHE